MKRVATLMSVLALVSGPVMADVCMHFEEAPNPHFDKNLKVVYESPERDDCNVEGDPGCYAPFYQVLRNKKTGEEIVLVYRGESACVWTPDQN